LFGIGVSQVTAQPVDDPVLGVRLWDARQSVRDIAEAVDSKEGWEPVPAEKTGHAFQGDAVLENERIVVAFCRRNGGPLVYSKPAEGHKEDGVRLVSVARDGAPATGLRSIKIRNHTEDEATLEICARTERGPESRVAFTLGRGRVFVKVKPLDEASRVQIQGATRYCVVPDFFGSDMVFDPRAYSQSKLILPSDNFLLNLQEGGNTIVMSVWPSDEQQAEVILAGSGDARRVRATEISFNGKSVYVAILQAPHIWHEHRLKPPYIDRDVPLGWSRPFRATWRANLCAGRRSDSWNFKDAKQKTWMYLYGSLFWPCWFDGDEGRVRLSKKFIRVKGSMERVLTYPSDRAKKTPLTVFTPVDIVRDTLGVGPCEYVLDREGLRHRSVNTGRRSFGRGVCDTTSPIEYFFLRGLETRERIVVHHLVDDILADNRGINARIHEFRQFGRGLGDLCAALKRNDGVPVPLIDEAGRTAKEIGALYERELKIIKTPPHAAKLGQGIKALTERRDPENLGKCKVLTRELRHIAGTQHRMVGDYRVMVKSLRQQAGIHGTAGPAAADAAEKIRQLAAQVLRRKYGVEAD